MQNYYQWGLSFLRCSRFMFNLRRFSFLLVAVVPFLLSSCSHNGPVNDLSSVASLGPDDAWAVGYDTDSDGNRALIEHWDGGTWNQVSCGCSGDNSMLTAVAGVSTRDVWAVGITTAVDGRRVPLIEHWDGSQWSTKVAPLAKQYDASLDAIQIVSANNIWAAGYYSSSHYGVYRREGVLIEHWDGERWSIVPGPTYEKRVTYSNILLPIEATDIWLTGTYTESSGGPSKLVFARWNGKSWKNSMYTPAGGYQSSLTSGIVLAANNAWFVGNFTSNSIHDAARTLILHWDGRAIKQVSSPNAGPAESYNYLNGISAVTAQDIWAVGLAGTSSPNHTLVEHWDGRGWKVVSSADVGTNDDTLEAVAAYSTHDVWAVGTTAGDGEDDTLVEHWDGAAWNVAGSQNPGTAYQGAVE